MHNSRSPRPPDLRADLDALESRAEAHGPIWLLRVLALRARLNDTEGARRVLAKMTTLIGSQHTSSGLGGTASDELAYLELAQAQVALLQGQAARSLEHLAVTQARLSHPSLMLAPWARALQAAGQHDAALQAWRAVLDADLYGQEEQEELAQAQLALAALLERAGRRREARALVDQLLVRWKDADADLVLLRRARGMLAALR